MNLVLLYCYNCDHKFSGNLALFCHDYNSNFRIFGCKKFTAIFITVVKQWSSAKESQTVTNFRVSDTDVTKANFAGSTEDQQSQDQERPKADKDNNTDKNGAE